MSLFISNPRVLLASTLVAAVLAGSGCSLVHRTTGIFHHHNSDYSRSQENRPLEVPPDLDTPATDPAMQIPSTRGAAASANGVPPAANAIAPAAANPSFSVADNAAGTWERIGRALDRIEGVTITQRAQAVGSYEVQYKGATMLLRATSEGAATRVDAVGPAGRSIRSPAAVELLGLLRDRIG